MFGCEEDVEGLDIGQEMLDFAPANDGEYIGDFLHQIGDCHFVI